MKKISLIVLSFLFVFSFMNSAQAGLQPSFDSNSGNWWCTTDRMFVDDENGGRMQVVSIPDMDGDLKDELLIGVIRDSDDRFWGGKVYLISSKTLAQSQYKYHRNFYLSNADHKFVGGNWFGRAGYALAAGNMDGDMIPDIVIGAPNHVFSRSYVYVFRGVDFVTGSPGNYTIRQGTTDLRSPGVMFKKFSSEKSGDRLGWSIAIGNVDGDQYGDILMGAPGQSDSKIPFLWKGKAYLVFGSSLFNSSGRFYNQSDISLNKQNGNNSGADREFQGERNWDQAGFSVAIGDVIQDSSMDRDDIFIGAPSARNRNNSMNAGKTYYFSADAIASMGQRQTVSLQSASQYQRSGWIEGNDSSTYCGKSLTTVNLLGYIKSQLVIGCPGARWSNQGGSRVKSGAAYIYNGLNGGTRYTTPADYTILSNRDSDQMGIFVAKAGDWDNDFASDLFVGCGNVSFSHNNETNRYSGGLVVGSVRVKQSPNTINFNENSNYLYRILGDSVGDRVGITASTGDMSGYTDLYIGTGKIVKPGYVWTFQKNYDADPYGVTVDAIVNDGSDTTVYAGRQFEFAVFANSAAGLDRIEINTLSAPITVTPSQVSLGGQINHAHFEGRVNSSAGSATYTIQATAYAQGGASSTATVRVRVVRLSSFWRK